MTDLPTGDFPRFRAVAERAVLAEFGDRVDAASHDEVIRLDGLLAASPFEGFVEAVPAFVNLLVCFDPLVTDHGSVERHLRKLLLGPRQAPKPGRLHQVEVCYDIDFAPDLEEVARQTGLSPEAVIAAQTGVDYSVAMYGFAPGYAYLSGVPEAIQIPRKPSPVRDMPAGSLMIAGPQALVTTLKMPTGWWIIGRSPTQILCDDPARPFLFDVGDRVRFRRIDRARFEAARPAVALEPETR